MDKIKRFYHSTAWIKLRANVIAERKGLCEECLKRGIVKEGFHCHHITELTEANVDDASISLNADNIMLLCHECHDNKHARACKRRFIVNDNGVICSHAGSDSPIG